jgi:pyruvate-ferredoxin/flavodoxin oxidoreductase
LTVDQHRARDAPAGTVCRSRDFDRAELNDALHAEATPEVRREQVAALRQALAGVEVPKSC